jgi:hypothetical protein
MRKTATIDVEKYIVKQIPPRQFSAAGAKVFFDAVAASCLHVIRPMLQRGFLDLPE